MLGKALTTAAAGNAGAGGLGIEDVFSTWLYTGNDSTQTITNGIDLAGEGGLVWTKPRITASFNDHILVDSARGDYEIRTNSANAQVSFPSMGFSNSGYVVPPNGRVNGLNVTYASWTFRKAPGFFDVVTYTGDGVAGRTVAHNLGSVPGFIVIKSTSESSGWYCYHRSLGVDKYLVLNTTEAASNYTLLNSIAPTSADFTLSGSGWNVNQNGATYVAYLFAHDEQIFGESGDQSVIKCGSYAGTGSTLAVELGWEPQWVLIKRTNSSTNSDWNLFDSMRRMPTVADGATDGNSAELNPNLSNAESANEDIHPYATGFRITSASAQIAGNGDTYIYIAIRRGPMKTPTAGTDVFYAETISQASTIDSTNVPFPPDLVNTFSRNGTDRTYGYNLFTFVDRLRGLGTPNNTYNASAPYLISSSTGAEDSINQSFVQLKADGRNITRGGGWDYALYGDWINYFFRRAPGFFDVVAYTGTGSTLTVNHNLGVVPELMIIKRRGISDWRVAFSFTPTQESLAKLNDSVAYASPFNYGSVVNSSQPTATSFQPQPGTDTNVNNELFIAYLFATCPGVSKVGSYTGTGTTLSVDCGFTNGARFVLIKRTDSTGDWYVWDTARGIVSGNDSYLLLNSTAAEVTNTDYIDPLSSGFQISSTAPAAINANGGSFIYLAIA